MKVMNTSRGLSTVEIFAFYDGELIFDFHVVYAYTILANVSTCVIGTNMYMY